jgi:hypothetical protein
MVVPYDERAAPEGTTTWSGAVDVMAPRYAAGFVDAALGTSVGSPR